MKKTAGLLLVFVLLIASSCTKQPESAFVAEQLNTTQEIVARIREDSLSRQGLVLVFTNQTDRELTMDMTYALEQEKDGTWYLLNGEESFPALAQILPAHDSAEFLVRFEKSLTPGSYRIVKPVWDSAGEAYLAQTFTLTEAASSRMPFK